MTKLTEWGCAQAVVVDRDLWSLQLCADGYQISEWIADAEVDFMLRQIFVGLATALPFRDQWPSSQLDEYDAVMPDMNGIQVLALGAAAIGNALAVGAPTKPVWDQAEITITVDNGKTQEVRTVRHASRITHLSRHDCWRVNRVAVELSSASDLLVDAELWFPHLDFCKEAEADLSVFPVTEDEFPVFVERLFDLDTSARAWRVGPLDVAALRGNPRHEGEAAMGMFANERTRTLQDGSPHVFSWHVNGRHGTRLYFDAIRPGKIIVGPITRHLRTKKFR